MLHRYSFSKINDDLPLWVMSRELKYSIAFCVRRKFSGAARPLHLPVCACGETRGLSVELPFVSLWIRTLVSSGCSAFLSTPLTFVKILQFFWAQFWMRALSPSDRKFLSRTPNPGVLCTPDRPPARLLVDGSWMD